MGPTKDKSSSMKTLRKVFMSVLNVALMYMLIMFLVCIFFVVSWQSGDGPWSRGVHKELLIISVLPLCLLDLVMISCAVTDLIMAVKLKRNSSDETRIIRKKAGKVLLISFEALIVVGLAEIIFAAIILHS